MTRTDRAAATERTEDARARRAARRAARRTDRQELRAEKFGTGRYF